LKPRVYFLGAALFAATFSSALCVSLNAQTGPQAQRGPSASSPTGNADNGKKLFTADGCYQCHGYEGQGSTATGPRLAPRPMPFAQLSKYVRAPTGQMPPYTAKVLSDQELSDIYAYLQSRPQAPAMDTLVLLKDVDQP
jgi:mono/diheme cytochrome c family protein